MEKNVYVVPEAEIDLLESDDVVLISVDGSLDIDKDSSVSW